jgi:hypothetical protein
MRAHEAGINTSSAMYNLLWGKRRERPRGRDLDRERGSYRERDNRKSNGLKGHHVSSGWTTTGAGIEGKTLMFVNESFTPGGSIRLSRACRAPRRRVFLPKARRSSLEDIGVRREPLGSRGNPIPLD